jgi:hypothetical protein
VESRSGGRSNCDSNRFKNNNSLRDHVMLISMKFKNIPHAETSQLKLPPLYNKVFWSLSLEQTLLDDRIVIYFVYFVEPEEKFNI